MRRLAVPHALGASCFAALVLAVLIARGQEPATGPATEKRFPPLKVPAGFKATLFACDPLIEYPSAIALGPRPGSLFVAVDYMTGLGTEIIRRDEIRLIEDTDGDGYADKATVFAAGFNSIEGLTYHNGTVFAMHAPLLTALRDTDGDGVADERRDLLSGLGLAPEDNPPRLHCANGIVAGHDGWLYLALGDHGCRVPRPEGDELVLEGGGILRCRPDGTDLHVFATGLRNIYDVALDDELNVFVRDNENDGGDYKIRVCHSFFGADHGYPYLYYEHPDEALPPLADLGLGSSAGGVAYLERQFPAEFRGNLFFCEWGRAVVRYGPQRSGSGFAPLREIEFAAGADNDPYGFKPTDLVVDYDGSLLVADWADGQRPRRGRGRIYRITFTGGATRASPRAGDDLIQQLDSESYFERCRAQAEIERRGGKLLERLIDPAARSQNDVRARLHAVWVIAHARGDHAVDDLFQIVKDDFEPRVRAQAVRALADLIDPVLVQHRLDAAPASDSVVARMATLGGDIDASVRLEAFVALGRTRSPTVADWLHLPQRVNPDAALAHAAMQALRRSQNWPATLRLLELPESDPSRVAALRAMPGQYDIALVDGLIRRLDIELEPRRRTTFAELLARNYKRPGPWTYWGYRPAPRPANTVAWERSEAIEQALDRVLADSAAAVRLAVLRTMLREKVPARAERIAAWLENERDPSTVATLIEGLDQQPLDAARHSLEYIIRSRDRDAGNRSAAMAVLARKLDAAGLDQLLDVATSVEDGPVLAESLRIATRRLRELRPSLAAAPRVSAQTATRLIEHLRSESADVRVAALDAAAALERTDAAESVTLLFDDADPHVRRAAATAAGKLRLNVATDSLLRFARESDDGALRQASLESLRELKEPRVVPLAVAALGDRATQLAALDCIRELGGPAQAGVVVELAKRSPSQEILSTVIRMLDSWVTTAPASSAARSELQRAVADVHGSSGMLSRWTVVGPIAAAAIPPVAERLARHEASANEPNEMLAAARTVFAAGADARVNLGSVNHSEDGQTWLVHADAAVPAETAVQFIASASGDFNVRLNGRVIHSSRDAADPPRPDVLRFDATLHAGVNRVLVVMPAPSNAVNFQLRYRPRGSTAEREQLADAALARTGNADRGRKLFFDAEKSLCVKCHRIGDVGERIGPELTGVGSRFSRVYIIESILEPNRTIAPSFDSIAIALKDGRVLTGLRVTETDTTLTLADNQAQKHVLAKSDIEERRAQTVSVMPDGLEKKLTSDEFVDLIAFLIGQK